MPQTKKAKKAPSTLSVQVTQHIDVELIRNLLCCAFEGGSNYWYDIEGIHYPPGRNYASYKEGGKGQDAETYWNWSQLIPTQEGGHLIITSKEGDEINGTKKWRLDREAIAKGLAIMAEKYPKHFGDVIAETEDADTGDVLLQLALFGELIYG